MQLTFELVSRTAHESGGALNFAGPFRRLDLPGVNPRSSRVSRRAYYGIYNTDQPLQGICRLEQCLLGRRLMILIALAISGSGAAISAVVPSLVGLIAGCAMQGLAGSLTPLDIGLARELLPPRKVSFAVGIISAAGIVGAGVTYLFAGWVTDHFASHGAFLMKTALAALAMIAVVKLVPKQGHRPANLERIDFVRGILFVPAIAGVLIGVDRIRVWGWLWAAGLIIPCSILLLIWARHQL